jgi:hypothetical protein
MQVMMPAKKFEIWKAQPAATLLVILGAAIPVVAIPAVAAILEAVTLGAIPAGYLAEVTRGAEVEGPPGEGRTLRTTPKCSRSFIPRNC